MEPNCLKCDGKREDYRRILCNKCNAEMNPTLKPGEISCDECSERYYQAAQQLTEAKRLLREALSFLSAAKCNCVYIGDGDTMECRRCDLAAPIRKFLGDGGGEETCKS